MSSIRSDDTIITINNSTRRNFPLAMRSTHFILPDKDRPSSEWNNTTNASVSAKEERSERSAIVFQEALDSFNLFAMVITFTFHWIFHWILRKVSGRHLVWNLCFAKKCDVMVNSTASVPGHLIIFVIKFTEAYTSIGRSIHTRLHTR